MYHLPMSIAAVLAFLLAADPAWESGVKAYRAARQAEIAADDGWLVVEGLYWLSQTANRAGTDPGFEVVLPRGPRSLGLFEYRGRVTFRADSGADVRLNGQPVKAVELKSDAGSKPDILEAGPLRMYVIKRGDRLGIRLRDLESERRKKFTGLKWYALKPEYRIQAKWVAEPKVIPIDNMIGQVEKRETPGYAVFTWKGKEFRMVPILDGKKLQFVFKDLTSGKETYPAARFLYAAEPKDGVIELDFNKAVNPPCAFTPYATCPLPPPANRLTFAVEAGERNFQY